MSREHSPAASELLVGERESRPRGCAFLMLFQGGWRPTGTIGHALSVKKIHVFFKTMTR